MLLVGMTIIFGKYSRNLHRYFAPVKLGSNLRPGYTCVVLRSISEIERSDRQL